MCGIGTNRRREYVGHTRDLSLPGSCNTGSVSARSAFRRYLQGEHTGLQTTRHEIPRIDAQLSTGGLLRPRRCSRCSGKIKVACARLCRDKAEVGASIFSCHRAAHGDREEVDASILATSLASLPLPSSEKCPFRPMKRVGRARALACLRLRRRARRRTLRLRRRP